MSGKRIEYIDIAKGIGIILVIIGHVVWGGYYPMPGARTISNFIYSFHMPLFFVISGLCIKDSKKNDKKTLKRMAKYYLVPYGVWTVLYLFAFELSAFIQNKASYISLENGIFVHAITICGIAPLWFLLALFIAEIIVLAIKTVLRDRRRITLFIFLLASLSIVTSIWYNTFEDINLITRNCLIGICRIFPTTLFVFIGYIIKDKMLEYVSWTWKKRGVILMALMVFQIVLCFGWNDAIDVHVFKLANPWLYFVKSLNGTFIVLLISQGIHSKTLSVLGGKTKELMILHYPPFYWTGALKFLLNKIFEPNILGLVIISSITMIGCVLTDRVMSKWNVWKRIIGK